MEENRNPYIDIPALFCRYGFKLPSTSAVYYSLQDPNYSVEDCIVDMIIASRNHLLKLNKGISYEEKRNTFEQAIELAKGLKEGPASQIKLYLEKDNQIIKDPFLITTISAAIESEIDKIINYLGEEFFNQSLGWPFYGELEPGQLESIEHFWKENTTQRVNGVRHIKNLLNEWRKELYLQNIFSVEAEEASRTNGAVDNYIKRENLLFFDLCLYIGAIESEPSGTDEIDIEYQKDQKIRDILRK